VASATARGATELVRVPQATVARLLATEPTVGSALMASLVAMVRHGDQKVADLSLRRLHHRVRRHLLDAAAPWLAGQENRAPDEVAVDLPINQTDLARQVGGSRQQVNRILADLGAAGALSRRGRRIVAIRPALLRFDD
jgi:CRP-like cAMP-binding protein